MKIFRCLFIVFIFVFLFGINATKLLSQTYEINSFEISRKERVYFKQFGTVEVRAVEELNKLPRVVFVDVKTKKVLSKIEIGKSEPDIFTIEDFSSRKSYPNVTFKILHIKGLPDPLVLATTVYAGGSDTAYEFSVIGAKDKAIQTLTPEPIFINTQGGIFVGYLGKKRGLGVAAWNFIWDDGAHYDLHRYKVNIYTFDNKTLEFKKGETLESKNKYKPRGEGALRELNLRVTDLRKTMRGLEYLKEKY